ATSNGFAGMHEISRHGITVVVLAGDSTAMERDYDYSSTIHGADLEDAATVGRRAGERAVKRLKPRKVPTSKVPIVFDPRVSGRQLGLASTGHASRGTSSPPSPSPTNLYFEPGTVSPTALMADIKAGLYVTEMMGMGVNGVTGDYSRGAAGFWIENGELGYAV